MLKLPGMRNLLAFLLFLWTTTTTVDAAAFLRLCEVDDDCQESFPDMTCREFLREYSLSGTCCSLSDSGDDSGCTLTVTGATTDTADGDSGFGENEATCTYDQRECPDCCSIDDEGNIGCVAPLQATIYSQNTTECPASEYDPFPSTFPLDPFSVTIVVGRDVGDENVVYDSEKLHEKARQTLEQYLERQMNDEYPGILIKLGKPWIAPSTRRRERRRQRRLGSGNNRIKPTWPSHRYQRQLRRTARARGRRLGNKIKSTLEFTGTAIVSPTIYAATEGVGNTKIRKKGIQTSQLNALDNLTTAWKSAKKVNVHS